MGVCLSVHLTHSLPGFYANHFSGSSKTFGLMCFSVCSLSEMTFDLNIWPADLP